MGVYLGASTKIVDRATGEVFMGRVPAYSVVVSGTMPGKPLPDGSPGPSLYCAVIVKRVDARHARQDLDQRAAARLMAPTDPVALTQALVRCPSVTPDAGAALDLLQRRWSRWASSATA